jgi:hypothetical protein
VTVRIKRHWFEDGRERSPEEKASVVAVAAWKCATHGLQGLRKAKFSVDVGVPFIRVLAEFLAFLVTAADRMAWLHGLTADDGSEGAGWREAFLNALARRVADLYRENLDQLIGPDESRAGGHATNFIDLLNRRMAEFAEFDYTEDGPDFGFMRYFGSCIEAALPDPADRRWVLDQIMATQAPEAIETVESAMRGVLGLDPKPARRREAASGE